MSDMATMQPKSTTSYTAASRNRLPEIILSGQSIMHRRPLTVKPIITMREPVLAPAFY